MPDAQPRLTVAPCSIKDANDYVAALHRHHRPVHRSRFAVAVADETGLVRGVAIVGNPVARRATGLGILEVRRVATDGCPNACSALYGACARVAREMGFRRLITYILESEPGTSLKASGWIRESETSGGSWSRANRPREDNHPLERKARWAKEFKVKYGDRLTWPSAVAAPDLIGDLFGEGSTG